MTASEGGRARREVRRSAIIYLPLFVLFTVVEAAVLVQPFTGGQWNILGLILVTPFFLVLAWHAVNLVQDLRSDLATTEGGVRRKWSRFDLPMSRSYYVYVESNVFRVPRDAWAKLIPGDRVSIRHLPHTATVDSLEYLRDDGDREMLA